VPADRRPGLATVERWLIIGGVILIQLAALAAVMLLPRM
jgi:hypothetical protein